MIVTPTIRELMLDKDRVGEIRDFIGEGREQYGMQTFDQHLEELVTSGTVEFGVALAASTRPSDFQLKMQMFNKSPVRAAAPAAPTPSPEGGGEPLSGGFGTGLEFLNG
jgi:twitching motility protein PilT